MESVYEDANIKPKRVARFMRSDLKFVRLLFYKHMNEKGEKKIDDRIMCNISTKIFFEIFVFLSFTLCAKCATICPVKAHLIV